MGVFAIIRIPCACVACTLMLDKSWISGIPSDEQDRYKTVTKCTYLTVLGSLTIVTLSNCRRSQPLLTHLMKYTRLLLMTCSSPRRTFFLHALSFECTSKLCITFLNQFSVYFHIQRMHDTI